MPAKRPTPKKVKHSIKPQRVKISGNLIVIIVGIIILGIGAWFLKPWNYFVSSPINQQIVITKPKPDFGRARQLTLLANKENVMQVMTREKVRITLEIPKGAVKEDIKVKLIPFYYDKNSKAPTAGVIVSPSTLSFSHPVTLSFNFSESTMKNKAPKNLKVMTLRTTGPAQVMELDGDATTLTPTLIARSVETENYLPARILNGGAYVFSLDGESQVAIAKKALNKSGMNSLVIMEAATTLLFNNQALSKDEVNRTKAAVAKVLSKESPPAFEMYAAIVLQKKLKGGSFSLVPKAHAYDTPEGYFQLVCKTDGLSVEEYLGFAQTAQLMGKDSIAENCMRQAKNKVSEQAEKVINNPNANIKEVLSALQDVQIIGLEAETNLDEQLMEKAKETAVNDAKKVANNPNSSPSDAAIELQKLQALGVDGGPTYDALEQRVTEAVEKYEEPKEDPLEAEATIVEEEVIDNAVWSAVGIAMLQAMGFEQLDKESLEKKFEEMLEGTKALRDAAAIMCDEFGEGSDCQSQIAEVDRQIPLAEAESYRVANEVGRVQSQGYEEPEYMENQGEVELYFEQDLTPTPEGGEGDQMEIGEESIEEAEEETQFDSGFEPQGQSIEQVDDQQDQTYQEEDNGYDMYESSSSEEAVEGASTQRSAFWDWIPTGLRNLLPF